MKKITLLLSVLMISISSFAIDDGTYPLTGAPFTGTITFDNTAQVFTITITNSPTTGYIGIGFASSSAGQMSGKYALYIANNSGSFELSEHTLVNYGLGTTLTTEASIDSQDFVNGDITISRSYASTNGGFSFTGTETELHFISAIGSTAGAYHGGSNRFKGAISVEGSLSANALPELAEVQLWNTERFVTLKFPNTAEGVYDLEVMNSIGQTVVKEQLDSNIPVHPLEELSLHPAGIYFLRLSQDGQFKTIKMFKD